MFIDSPRFPDSVSYGAVGGPCYSTDVVVINSGYEQRNINWDVARAEYDVSHGIKSQAQLDELITFFRIAKGKAHSFRFKDWLDYTVVAAYSRLNLISGNTYQLQKVYNHAGGTEYRDIQRPVSGTVTVYSDGSPFGGASVDYLNGIVTITGSPGVLTWGGEFDVPCRFDTDRMQAAADDDGIYSWGSIPLVEVRVYDQPLEYAPSSRAALISGKAPTVVVV